MLRRNSSSFQTTLETDDAVEEQRRRSERRLQAKNRLKTAARKVLLAGKFVKAAQDAMAEADEDNEDNAEDVADIDEEFLPVTDKHRRQAALAHVLDHVVGAATGVLCSLPMTVLSSNWNFTELSLEKGTIDFETYMKHGRWGSIPTILAGKGFWGTSRFFPGLPIALGARAFEVTLFQAPSLCAYALFDYELGSQPWREAFAKVAASLIVTPTKVAAEIALSRRLAAHRNGTTAQAPAFEPFSDTAKSVQPWILAWRMLHNAYLQVQGTPAIDDDNWLCDLSDATSRLAPASSVCGERRTVRESLATVASQTLYSKLATFAFHVPFLLMDAPFFGSTKHSTLRGWFLACGMGSVSLLAKPGWCACDLGAKDTLVGLGHILVGVGPAIVWSVGANLLATKAYSALRWRLGLEVMDDPAQRLLRKLRAVEVSKGGQVRARLELGPAAATGAAAAKPLGRAAAGGGVGVEEGDVVDDFDEDEPPPPTPTPMHRQATVDVKQAAVPALAGKRLALLSRLRCHYVPGAAPAFDAANQGAAVPSLEEALLVSGTSAEAVMFHEPTLCSPAQALLFAIRNEPAPSLAQVALLPRHALVAQVYPVDESGESLDFRDPGNVAKFLLKVHFTNETAQDIGGSFREFMDLMGTYIREACSFHLEEDNCEHKASVPTASPSSSSSSGEGGANLPTPAAPPSAPKLPAQAMAAAASVSAGESGGVVGRSGGGSDGDGWEVGDELEACISQVYTRGVVVAKNVPPKLKFWGETTLTVKCLFGADRAEALASEDNQPYEMKLSEVRPCAGALRKLFAAGPDGGLLPLRSRVPQSELEAEAAAKAAAAAGAGSGGGGAGPSSPSQGAKKYQQGVGKSGYDEEMARWADDRQAYFAIGRLMALAVLRNTPLDVPFSRCLYKILAGEAFTAADVKRIDASFFKHRIEPLLAEGGVAAMEEVLCDSLFFVGVTNPNDVAAGGGHPEGDELVPGGRTKKVTERNKRKYLRLLMEHYLVGHCRRELSYLAQGFFDVIPKSVLHIGGGGSSSAKEAGGTASADAAAAGQARLSAVDLELMVCGIPTLDVGEWRKHTEGVLSDQHLGEALAYAKSLDRSKPDDRDKLEQVTQYIAVVSNMVNWFWELVVAMDVPTRAKLLAFACGTGRLPADGFRALRPKFRLELAANEPDTNLPSSHTCFNQLVIPGYKSKAQMKEKLHQALGYTAEGFGFI